MVNWISACLASPASDACTMEASLGAATCSVLAWVGLARVHRFMTIFASPTIDALTVIVNT